jgi:hypothetical protein
VFSDARESLVEDTALVKTDTALEVAGLLTLGVKGFPPRHSIRKNLISRVWREDGAIPSSNKRAAAKYQKRTLPNIRTVLFPIKRVRNS